MNYFKKTLLQILLLLIIPIAAVSQDNKTVTLTVSAQGQTISEAKQNALRDAIEQAFGAFVSSNTEILNDELIKDEIVSVSNGNIQDYDVISEIELPKGGYATILKATVSITKLTSFAESKGANIEFKGGLFAANMMQQELNEKAELKAVKNIIEASKSIFNKSFDYSIEASRVVATEYDYSNMKPIYSIKPSNPIKSDDIYKIPLTIKIKLNNNFDAFRKYFNTSMRQLSMSTEEIKSYSETGKSFDLLLSYDEDNKKNPPHPVYFRNKNSIEEVEKFILSFKKLILSFAIYNDIDFLTGDEIFSLNDFYNRYASEFLHDAKIIDYFRIYHYEYDKNVFPSLFLVPSSSVDHQSAIYYIRPRTIVNSNSFHIDLKSISPIKNFKYNFNNKDVKLIKEFEANTIVLQERNLILNFYNFYSSDWGPNYLGEWNRNYIKTKVPEEFFKEKSIIWINFNDTKTLDEIKQISEYTIKPISD